MKITVINNRSAGGLSVPCVDSTQCLAGTTKVMTGRTKEEVQFMQAQADGVNVIVLAEIEGKDRAPLICDMKANGTATGGATTKTGVGFDLETESGAAANVAPQMYLGAFDDAAFTTPAENATLDTAANGTIDAGAGTNLLKITPDAAGIGSVTMTNAEDELVYVKAWPVGTDYVIDTSDHQEITFEA